MKMLRKATNIFDGTVNFLALLAAVILILVMFAVLYEVVMRYFLNRPTIWVLEYTEFSLLFITFLGATWLLRRGGHVRMDVVLSRFAPRTQTVVNIITSILAAIVFLFITGYGVVATWDSFVAGKSTHSLLQTPIFPIMFIIPVGSFFFFIQLLRRIHSYFGIWRASSDKEQGL